MRPKRVLLIAQPFAPYSGSHATRINGLVEALLLQGHKVDVLTTTIHKGIPGLDWSLLRQVSGASVHRAFCGPLHYASYLRNRWRSAPPQIHAIAVRAKKAFFVPDTYIEWIPFATLLLSFLWFSRKFRPDLIVSSSMPYSCHLVALLAKKLFKVPWIADFGDPWVIEISVPRGPTRLAVERALESAVVNAADHIAWTTSTTRDAYRAMYPHKSGRMHVVYMGYRARDFENPSQAGSLSVDTTSLAYAGRVNVEHRNGSRFFELLDGLRRFGSFRLCIAGSDLEGLTRPLDELRKDGVEILGFLDHEQFVNLLRRSDALVLLGNRSPLQIPGKLFQYIGSGKPILYIKNMPASAYDETQAILTKSGVPNIALQLEGSIDAKGIAAFLIASKSQMPDRTRLREYTWDERARQLISIANMPS